LKARSGVSRSKSCFKVPEHRRGKNEFVIHDEKREDSSAADRWNAVVRRGVCAISLGNNPDALVKDLQDRFPKAHLVGGEREFEVPPTVKNGSCARGDS
jgi:hypothetical protein